ncbi:hypothetical protein pipiens_009889 [Culex pipiens pipiens]|uniref:Uncharacterized protein n=1 Tax=Culex pipiens pipiens TaxID=38569 RepID=A0ABD1DCF6_CULPP
MVPQPLVPAFVFINELADIGIKASTRKRSAITLFIVNINRVEILDPTLHGFGCLDRNIKFPHQNEEANGQIMQIQSSF